MRFLAVVACLFVLAPARAQAADQSVRSTRPNGQLVIAVRGDDVAVVDTRAADPGWTIAGVDGVAATTPAFTDGFGVRYSQEVTTYGGVAIAPAHHGLGVAHLTIHRSGNTVSLTII